MLMRLQKIISDRGIMSRRSAENYIADGRVTVNGLTAVIGEKADPDTDIIAIDGVIIGKSEEKITIMLNKPMGVLTTMSDDRGRKTTADLTVDVGTRVYPIGRLDLDTEGLLLLTNDGELANTLMHPSFEKHKTYYLNVKGSSDNIKKLGEEMEIDGYRIKKAEINILSQHDGITELNLTIHEGRNRQIRKMCEIAGVNLLFLRRVAIGGLKLGELPIGKWRVVSKEEIHNALEKIQIQQ